MTLLKFPFSPLFYIFIWGQFKLWFLDSNNMHHRNNISMRCTFLSLFICYLHNLMPLVEYVKKNKKEIKGSPKHPLIYLSIHFIIIIFLIPILGFTNPTPLNRNLVPEISKKEVATSLICRLCPSFQVVLIPKFSFSKFITQISMWLGNHGYIYVYPPYYVG
jgi:hypothetical protein